MSIGNTIGCCKLLFSLLILYSAVPELGTLFIHTTLLKIGVHMATIKKQPDSPWKQNKINNYTVDLALKHGIRNTDSPHPPHSCKSRYLLTPPKPNY